ncbi:Ophiobolin F synthase [Colletotrichum shisoi]|uniref:Ophiobolin F synthase n=1 Tax=Colletotrichum shisoi TaxID=2078593 RepID=A0A5Q4BTT6_9PEZI|nr:Ophiobolin F synthase [Colletotrichum shisoi]
MASFARPVSEAVVASSGSRSKFPAYIHQSYGKCVKAAKETEHEYNQAMSTDIKSKTLADIPGLGLVHPMALTIANCLPDRLAAITRFADFTILNFDYKRTKALLPDGSNLSTYASRVAAAPDHPVMAPFKYIASLPSKGVRDTFIDALNWWLKVPDDSLLSIKTVIRMLHDSSLMQVEMSLTIEDGNTDRGTAQCINAANYMVVMVLVEIQKLRSPIKLDILSEELENLFLGQSEDLFWKYRVECPSTEEYMEMIENKTGGLFRLCVRLLQAESTGDDVRNLDPRPFYAKQKGFAEDLEEGKISLPMTLTLQRMRTRPEIMGIMKHKKPGPMSMGMKQFILAEMRKSGAL